MNPGVSPVLAHVFWLRLDRLQDSVSFHPSSFYWSEIQPANKDLINYHNRWWWPVTSVFSSLQLASTSSCADGRYMVACPKPAESLIQHEQPSTTSCSHHLDHFIRPFIQVNLGSPWEFFLHPLRKRTSADHWHGFMQVLHISQPTLSEHSPRTTTITDWRTPPLDCYRKDVAFWR